MVNLRHSCPITEGAKTCVTLLYCTIPDDKRRFGTIGRLTLPFSPVAHANAITPPSAMTDGLLGCKLTTRKAHESASLSSTIDK